MTTWQIRTPNGHGIALVRAATADEAVAIHTDTAWRAREREMAGWNGVGCSWYPLIRGLYAVAVPS
jgi:hypothetical protein